MTDPLRILIVDDHAVVRAGLRLLLQAEEKGSAETLPRALSRLPPRVQSALTAQARNFRGPELEAIYHRLLDIDLADKSGQTDLAAGLEALVAEWAA